MLCVYYRLPLQEEVYGFSSLLNHALIRLFEVIHPVFGIHPGHKRLEVILFALFGVLVKRRNTRERPWELDRSQELQISTTSR